MAREKVDVTSFQDLNKVKVQGLPDVTGQLSGFWDEAEVKVFTASEETAGVRMYLYPSADAPTHYWYGLAWVDYNLDVAVGDAAKMAMTFEAAGSWARKP